MAAGVFARGCEPRGTYLLGGKGAGLQFALLSARVSSVAMMNPQFAGWNFWRQGNFRMARGLPRQKKKPDAG